MIKALSFLCLLLAVSCTLNYYEYVVDTKPMVTKYHLGPISGDHTFQAHFALLPGSKSSLRNIKVWLGSQSCNTRFESNNAYSMCQVRGISVNDLVLSYSIPEASSLPSSLEGKLEQVRLEIASWQTRNPSQVTWYHKTTEVFRSSRTVNKLLSFEDSQ